MKGYAGTLVSRANLPIGEIDGILIAVLGGDAGRDGGDVHRGRTCQPSRRQGEDGDK